MADANRPGSGEGRAEDSQSGKAARPGSPGQDTGEDAGSDLSGAEQRAGQPTGQDVTGQRNKPGIGEPGRGGDDLSGHGTQRSDSRGAEAGSQSGDWQSGDQQNIPGRSPGGGPNPASRQHSPSAADETEAPESGHGREPRSTGQESTGGNEGAY